MMEITQAQPQEDHDFARLVLFSAPNLLPALFGPRTEELLRYLFTRRHSLFHFEHVRFARDHHGAIGVSLALDAQHYTRAGLHLAYGILGFDTIGAIPFFYRLIKAHRLMQGLVPGQYYLNSLAVDPDHRGKGVGKALLSLFEQEGKKMGLQEAALDVEENNSDAERFYLREGYIARKHTPPLTINHQQFRLIRMVKRLS